ncbi:hypothetical protein DPMN_157648 [Dreissena polymorpha]|uniref:Uncharacterized protein n=1 Tax=Dreissena polymorpha TaxID=45954 RepID=A0A9D4IMG5_DREPO|nr:hypothetical protein DPMN_157648 [Dreissena polymorpha]
MKLSMMLNKKTRYRATFISTMLHVAECIVTATISEPLPFNSGGSYKPLTSCNTVLMHPSWHYIAVCLFSLRSFGLERKTDTETDVQTAAFKLCGWGESFDE